MEHYLGESIPKLGFGLMRLPRTGESIDLEQTKQMVDLFMDAGFRYFDTAYGYRDSEAAIKTTLVDRYPRESYLLATKLPAWADANSKEEAEQMFYTSLERTGAGYFDFYLLHNVGQTRTAKFDEYGIWDFLQKRKEEGLIRHLGFSCHDNAQALDKLLTEHPEMEFVQLQINYADWENPGVQSRLCYETARKHNKPVIIMEPVKGGLLSKLPPKVSAPLLAADPDASLSSWAVRFAASLPGVITVLSGMSTVEQMQDNLSYMKDFRPLSESEQAVIAQARSVMDSIPIIPCTACGYCLSGCPKEISIPWSMESMNLNRVYEDFNAAKMNYGISLFIQKKAPAGECIGCGKCEKVCPQQLPIMDLMKQASELFDSSPMHP